MTDVVLWTIPVYLGFLVVWWFLVYLGGPWYRHVSDAPPRMQRRQAEEAWSLVAIPPIIPTLLWAISSLRARTRD